MERKTAKIGEIIVKVAYYWGGRGRQTNIERWAEK